MRAPLDREPVGVQPQAGKQPDAFRKAVIVIAGVERWLDEQGGLDVLENPEVAVNVVAFDLVGRGGGSPQKSVGKGIRGVVVR